MLTCPVCHTENDEGQEACRTCRTPLPLDVRQAQPPPANGQADQTAKPTTVRQDPWVGRMLGEYKVLGILGRGGMGVVYRAEDVALGRHVALKMVSAELAGNPQMLERFRHEARIQARLSHPGIATVYAFKEVEGEAFLVMELVEGETLRSRLVRCGSLAPAEAVPIASQVLEAMAYAHRMGVIHRDLKPANIVLTPQGTVKIMDFGIAKLLRQQQSQLTVKGSLMGTLRYMAPEQIKGASVDHRADIYSLGATFYEMLAGRPPFEAETDVEVMQAHLEKTPAPPSRFNPSIGSALDRVLLKALEKEPSQRYQEAQAFAEALERAWREAAPSQAVPDSDQPTVALQKETVALEPAMRAPASEAAPSSRRALWAAAAVVLLLAAGGMWWFWPEGEGPVEPRQPEPVGAKPAAVALQAEPAAVSPSDGVERPAPAPRETPAPPGVSAARKAEESAPARPGPPPAAEPPVRVTRKAEKGVPRASAPRPSRVASVSAAKPPGAPERPVQRAPRAALPPAPKAPKVPRPVTFSINAPQLALKALVPGQEYFVKTALHVIRGDEIYWVNYMSPRKTQLIRAGERVTITKIEDQVIEFDFEGKTYHFEFTRDGYDEPVKLYNKFFTPVDINRMIDRLPEELQNKIRNGKVERGMTKDQVLLAVGCPAIVDRRKTHNMTLEEILSSDTWIYYYTRFNRWQARFYKNKLVSIRN